MSPQLHATLLPQQIGYCDCTKSNITPLHQTLLLQDGANNLQARSFHSFHSALVSTTSSNTTHLAVFTNLVPIQPHQPIVYSFTDLIRELNLQKSSSTWVSRMDQLLELTHTLIVVLVLDWLKQFTFQKTLAVKMATRINLEHLNFKFIFNGPFSQTRGMQSTTRANSDCNTQTLGNLPQSSELNQ